MIIFICQNQVFFYTIKFNYIAGQRLSNETTGNLLSALGNKAKAKHNAQLCSNGWPQLHLEDHNHGQREHRNLQKMVSNSQNDTVNQAVKVIKKNSC